MNLKTRGRMRKETNICRILSSACLAWLTSLTIDCINAALKNGFQLTQSLFHISTSVRLLHS